MSTRASSCEPLTQCLGAPSCYTSGRYVSLKQQVSPGQRGTVYTTTGRCVGAGLLAEAVSGFVLGDDDG
ncbi:unnamed protein product [Arctogadus glacialis]